MKTLSIHTTDICNSACLFCVVGVPDMKGDTIIPGRVEQLLRENAHKGFDVVNLHGGEPTVHKNFLEILELIRDLGYPSVQLQTNGWKLRDPAFTNQLRRLNVELFINSLHGATPETHDSVTRCPGSFRAALDAIHNCSRNGGKVRTNTVVLKQNLEELSELVDCAIDQGAEHINISNIHPVFTAYRHFETLVPTVGEVARWVPPAVFRARAHDAEVTLEGFPICAVPGCESYHLGRRYGVMKMEIRGLWISDYDKYMDEECRAKREECGTCSYYDACGGVYNEYVEKRGWSEFVPILPQTSNALKPHVVPKETRLGQGLPGSRVELPVIGG